MPYEIVRGQKIMRGRTRGPSRGFGGRGYGRDRRPMVIETTREYVSFNEDDQPTQRTAVFQGSKSSKGRKSPKSLPEGRYFELQKEDEESQVTHVKCPGCKGGRFLVSVVRSQDWHKCRNCNGSGLVNANDVWDDDTKKNMVFLANKGCKQRTHVCTKCRESELLPVKDTMEGFLPLRIICTPEQEQIIPEAIQEDDQEWQKRGFDPKTIKRVVILGNENIEEQLDKVKDPPSPSAPQGSNVENKPVAVKDPARKTATPPLTRKQRIEHLVASSRKGLAGTSETEVMQVYSSWTPARRDLIFKLAWQIESLHLEIMDRLQNTEQSIEDLIELINGIVWSLMDPKRHSTCSMLRQMWSEAINRVKLSFPQPLIALWLDQVEDPGVVYARRLAAQQISKQLFSSKEKDMDTEAVIPQTAKLTISSPSPEKSEISQAQETAGSSGSDPIARPIESPSKIDTM